MNGYKMHGSIVMNNIQTSASTYCENIGYGKAVKLTYYYYNNHAIMTEKKGSLTTFVTNDFDSYEGHYTYTSKTNQHLGAIGRHKVKASEYMIWYSHQCADDTSVGSVIPDYSDVQ